MNVTLFPVKFIYICERTLTNMNPGPFTYEHFTQALQCDIPDILTVDPEHDSYDTIAAKWGAMATDGGALWALIYGVKEGGRSG